MIPATATTLPSALMVATPPLRVGATLGAYVAMDTRTVQEERVITLRIYMQVTCLSHACHMQVTCLSHAGHTSLIGEIGRASSAAVSGLGSRPGSRSCTAKAETTSPTYPSPQTRPHAHPPVVAPVGVAQVSAIVGISGGAS